MSKTPGKSIWRNPTRVLFRISIAALVLFNAYAAIGKRAMTQSIERTQTEIDTCNEQLQVLRPLKNQFYNRFLAEFSGLEAQVRRMHERLPILDNEFVVTKIDGHYRSGERTICLSAPAAGQHSLRIQITYRGEKLLDRQSNLVAGGSYKIGFDLSQDNLKVLFPGQEPVNINLDKFLFTNRISNLRTSLTGSPVFTSCNQPRWKLRSSFKSEEYGVLALFAYMSEAFEQEEHLVVRITAESDGPPTAAADDPATVLHLGPLLESGYEPEYEFKDGRYIFER